jgi:predicted GNAT family acetyltransferase
VSDRVVDNAEKSQFELRIGDDVALAAYRKRGDQIVFTHTEVPKHLEGHGVGAELAKAALDSARAQGLRVVPRCPFIDAYIKRHPEYQDLLAG